MKKQQTKKSQKNKLSSLILLIAFTAIMLIVSTYAWFSTQKDVTIQGLQGTVQVAEGLEISLNAKDWSQVIDLGNANLKEPDSTKTYSTFEGNNNHILDENVNMTPVSTSGTETSEVAVSETNKYKTLSFYNGIATAKELKDIVACDEKESTVAANNFAGYYAFDVFLRNTTRTGDFDAIQITKDSVCEILNSGDTDKSAEEATGLQNSARVAIALYGDKTSGWSEYTDADTAIIANSKGKDISAVAVWEPNANYHVNYTQKYFTTGAINVLTPTGFKSSTTNTNEKVSNKFVPNVLGATHASDSEKKLELVNSMRLATYGINANALKTYTDTSVQPEKVYSNYIENVYDYKTNSGANKKVSATESVPVVTEQKTLQTTVAVTTGAVTSYAMEQDNYRTRQLVDSLSNYATTNDGSEYFALPANKVVRARIFVWLEGQDIDCISYASHGGGVQLDVGFEKQGTTGGADSYEVVTSAVGGAQVKTNF